MKERREEQRNKEEKCFCVYKKQCSVKLQCPVDSWRHWEHSIKQGTIPKPHRLSILVGGGRQYESKNEPMPITTNLPHSVDDNKC